ncbi:hypothetical protein BpHYR1_023581 [Brachionus plicatilis]|uniref:Uncharacterized protein n=1 Tax=Brachionus plicatilis TaxID=10195 RepID=A0A3M7TDP9_BRAPC|nr:hypothetical protein BpHYR1_023581 [Brachionus plicatilis]
MSRMATSSIFSNFSISSSIDPIATSFLSSFANKSLLFSSKFFTKLIEPNFCIYKLVSTFSKTRSIDNLDCRSLSHILKSLIPSIRVIVLLVDLGDS